MVLSKSAGVKAVNQLLYVPAVLVIGHLHCYQVARLISLPRPVLKIFRYVAGYSIYCSSSIPDFFAPLSGSVLYWNFPTKKGS
jgi:hypothetical protein